MFSIVREETTSLYFKIPDEYSKHGYMSDWLKMQQRGRPMGSFIEGPSFDRAGNLFFVDIAHGRVFKICIETRTLVLLADYDGQPNGLKIHKDGRIFIADYANGIIELDPESGKISTFLGKERFPDFKGFNDLFFASNGDLYFTDQGYTGLHDLTGRVWRYTYNRRLQCLLKGIPSPNGLVMSVDETQIFLAVTRANAIWRLPLLLDGSLSKVGTFIQMSGGIGPDGLAINEKNQLLVAHVGAGSVWLFSDIGEPLRRFRSSAGLLTTNLAFGGPNNMSLYVTESESGSILVAEVDTPGQRMFSHMV